MSYEYWFDMITPDIKILTKEEKRKRTIIKMGTLYMFDNNKAGILWIKDSFASKCLGDIMSIMTPYFKIGFNPYKESILTEVKCPFCEDGVLELLKKEKEICETHVCHTGDSFTFQCSKRCKNPYILYSYSYTWRYC